MFKEQQNCNDPDESRKACFVLRLKLNKVSVSCQCVKIETKKVNNKSKTTTKITETKSICPLIALVPDGHNTS